VEENVTNLHRSNIRQFSYQGCACEWGDSLLFACDLLFTLRTLGPYWPQHSILILSSICSFFIILHLASSFLLSCLSPCSFLPSWAVVLSRTNKACSTIISGYSYDATTVVAVSEVGTFVPSFIARSLQLVSIQFRSGPTILDRDVDWVRDVVRWGNKAWQVMHRYHSRGGARQGFNWLADNNKWCRMLYVRCKNVWLLSGANSGLTSFIKWSATPSRVFVLVVLSWSCWFVLSHVQ